MSSGVDWLQKQRKTDLNEIASTTGLRSYQKMNKEELTVVLEEHLRANMNRFAAQPEVAPFYQGADVLSPLKPKLAKLADRISIGPTSDDEQKKPRRRQTIQAKKEADSPNSLQAALTKTPAARKAMDIAANIRLPPSPAMLANQIDAQTSSMRRSISHSVSTSRLPRYINCTRKTLSNATSIQLLVLLIEAWGLRGQVLPQRYLATIPPMPAIGQTSSTHVQAPDLFALLTCAFWGPVWVWMCVSIILPCVAGYFVNLKGPQEQGGWCDSVSFNVTKALVAWIVFVRGGVQGESVEVVREGIFGGTMGLFIGAGVGGLAGLYEAILKH